MKTIKTYTINWCYLEEHLGFFFRIFRLYPAPRMRFEVEKTWDWNLSIKKIAIPWILSNRIRWKMNGSTDAIEKNVQNEIWTWKNVIRTWSYDLIFQLTEQEDDSFNRSYLVEYMELFTEFFVHTFFRKKIKSNFNTFTNDIQEKNFQFS